MRFCVFASKHDAWPFARGLDGQDYCTIDFPIRLDETDLYWSYPEEGGLISFDDATSTATMYAVEGDPGVERPYTTEEQDRADARANDAAVKLAQAELDRAVQLNAAPAQLAVLQEANLANDGIEPGDPWRQPTGAHDAYPLGAIVSHNSKNWTSTVAANVWEPGVSGWSETGGGIPDWVQPTGAHDAYALGAVVRHNALVWQSTVDANVWEPGVFGWQEIPDPEA